MSVEGDRLLREVRAAVQETVRDELRESIEIIIDAKINERLHPLADAIGRVNDLKTGGTGLAGELARQNAKIEQLFMLRNIGTGIAISVSLSGALLWLGLKQLFTTLTDK